MDDKLKLPYQGRLIKFTNVVKGWQTRWFIIDPERGVLEYYLVSLLLLLGLVVTANFYILFIFKVDSRKNEKFNLFVMYVDILGSMQLVC